MHSLSAPSAPSGKGKVCKKPLSKQIELGVGAFLFISTICICLLSLLFLSHNNRVATRGYELRMLQEKRAALLHEQEVLSMQIADLQSLRAMENDAVLQRMVRVDRPQYIRVDTAVAFGEKENPDG